MSGAHFIREWGDPVATGHNRADNFLVLREHRFFPRVEAPFHLDAVVFPSNVDMSDAKQTVHNLIERIMG